MSNPKILHISGSMPPLHCGIGYYINRLMDRMDRDFDLLTTAGLNQHPSANQTHFVNNWKITSLPKIFRVVREGKYAVVHIQYPAKGYKRNLGINKLPYLVRSLTKSKIIITLHEYHGSGFLGKTRNLITCLPAHKIVVSNNYDYAEVPTFLRRKTVIIPIGGNIQKYKPDPEFVKSIFSDAGFDASKPTAIYFGLVYPNKGIETAIKAAENSNTQLFVVGELNEQDPYQKSVLNLIENSRAKQKVVYSAGRLSDKRASQLMQSCEYFVLSQPLPLTAKSGTSIAAATNELLIISTAADNPDMNLPYINDVNSILIKPMDVRNLTQTLNNIPNKLKYKEEIIKLSQHFSWELISKKHNEMYEEYLD